MNVYEEMEKEISQREQIERELIDHQRPTLMYTMEDRAIEESAQLWEHLGKLEDIYTDRLRERINNEANLCADIAAEAYRTATGRPMEPEKIDQVRSRALSQYHYTLHMCRMTEYFRELRKL